MLPSTCEGSVARKVSAGPHAVCAAKAAIPIAIMAKASGTCSITRTKSAAMPATPMTVAVTIRAPSVAARPFR